MGHPSRHELFYESRHLGINQLTSNIAPPLPNVISPSWELAILECSHHTQKLQKQSFLAGQLILIGMFLEHTKMVLNGVKYIFVILRRDRMFLQHYGTVLIGTLNPEA